MTPTVGEIHVLSQIQESGTDKILVGEIALRALPRTVGLDQEHGSMPVSLIQKWAKTAKVDQW